MLTTTAVQQVERHAAMGSVIAGLPIGVPALLLLLVLLLVVVVAMRKSGCALRLPCTLVSLADGTPSASARRAGRFFALATAWVAVPFWVWAVSHTLHGSVDAGVLTFLVVMIGAAGYCWVCESRVWAFKTASACSTSVMNVSHSTAVLVV